MTITVIIAIGFVLATAQKTFILRILLEFSKRLHQFCRLMCNCIKMSLLTFQLDDCLIMQGLQFCVDSSITTSSDARKSCCELLDIIHDGSSDIARMFTCARSVGSTVHQLQLHGSTRFVQQRFQATRYLDDVALTNYSAIFTLKLAGEISRGF